MKKATKRRIAECASGHEPLSPQYKEPPSRIIRSMDDLYDHFEPSERTYCSLDRRIYKDTDCGASISVYGTSGGKPVVFHSGNKADLPADFLLTGFTLQTIVEGSDATVDSPTFVAGVATTEAVDNWIAQMERQADVLWREANEG